MKLIKCGTRFLMAGIIVCSSTVAHSQDWLLDKMPADLETDFALSSLPPHLRGGATVYLLDPKKGYYISRQGTNGFSVYVNRTEWERSEFVQDTYAALGFDAEGSKTLLQAFMDIAAMRASGKYSPTQLRDSVVKKVKDGRFKAPARSGICYMLSPLLRTYDGDQRIINMAMPHYMFYAPYVEDSDIGGMWVTGGHHPFVVSTGPVLAKAYSIFNYIILAAGEIEKAKIIEEQKDLLRRMAEYKSILKIDLSKQNHDHK